MTYELEEIKKIRKKLGLTQTDLAKRSGVSQSLIAKIESRRIDPTYTKTMKIFSALRDLEKKGEAKAAQLMVSKIIDIGPDASVKDAISKMKKFNISQLPVVDSHHKLIGIVSESTMLDALMDGKAKAVKDIIQEPPPIVSKSTSVQVVSSLLRHFPMVIVSEEGKIIGLITKADLLGKIYG